MKNIQKLFLFFIVFFMALILNVSFCNAETSAQTYTADSYDNLVSAIEQAKTGDTVQLTENIEVKSPIKITDKNITIDGATHTISKASDFALSSNDGSLITVGPGGIATLTGLTLKGSEKYGVQAYNGGHVILDDVVIKECKFGGVLVNGGTVEVVNLTLGFNGESRNNGIEIGKGDEVTNDPKIVMNGTLTSDQTENVIYIATNDSLTDFEVENTPDSEYKVLVEGDKVVVVDEQNHILYESNSNPNITIDGNDFVPTVTVTVRVMDKVVTITKQEGETITKEDVISRIDLSALGFGDYSIEGFYLDNYYTTPYDFEQNLTQDLTIYTKLTLNEKDDTPKTGVRNYMIIAVSIIAISIVSFVTLRRKDI